MRNLKHKRSKGKPSSSLFSQQTFVVLAAREQAGDQSLRMKVLQLAWAYVLGGVVGSIVGKLVGTVLFGPVGHLLGDSLGDQAGSVIGLMLMRRQPGQDYVPAVR